MNAKLLKPYSEEEVCVALFQMHPSKALGPDGHFLQNKRWGRKGSFALKLDLSKAYDRVEWNFLEAMMLRLGFDSRLVAVMMMCVKSVSYSFLVNGEECGFVVPSHDLRQVSCLVRRSWKSVQRFNIFWICSAKHQDPKSLTARLFKAKYHPHSSFWDASVPSSSSYCWSSILKARIVLEKGSRWLIGDGASVYVWKDRWVPKPSTFHPITQPPPSRENMLVQELIDKERRMLCDTKLSAYFEEKDREHIRALPISNSLPPDKLVWHYTDRGQFTVKSAYEVAWDYVKPPSLSASSSALGGNPFTPLWKAIWQAGVPPKVAVELVTAAQHCRPRDGLTGDGEGVAEDWVWLNVDGATNLQNKVGGAGVVLRDRQGHFFAAAASFLPTMTSALQAEMLANKRAVEVTHQLGFQKVLVRSDSSQAISIIHTCVDRVLAMDFLAEDVLDIAKAFIASKFIFISRNNNSIAHCLAKVALYVETSIVWVEEPPSVIQDLLIHDIL
ncbi:uncharacterized protein [Malus domestica]|uniref:uncharacterized protein n=1 Tax=Malus domestica TaxID=3750 RepID=UPI003974B94B